MGIFGGTGGGIFGGSNDMWSDIVGLIIVLIVLQFLCGCVFSGGLGGRGC